MFPCLRTLTAFLEDLGLSLSTQWRFTTLSKSSSGDPNTPFRLLEALNTHGAQTYM